MGSPRIGIVGLGSMGSKHLDTLVRTKVAHVAAIATRSAEKRAAVAARLGVDTVADYRELAQKVDAVIVTVPTILHAEVAQYFLEQKVHVLLEKPITATVAEARLLVSIAERSGAVFMIGHSERFNPAYIRLQQVMHERDSHGSAAVQVFRMGPYDGRAQDVGVELDLMIHDVDALTGLFPSCTFSLREALGVRVVTNFADSTQACIAIVQNGRELGSAVLMASRVADAKRRLLRVAQGGFRAELDFMNQTLKVAIGSGNFDEVFVEKAFPLDGELSHFVTCVKTGAQPAVSGANGLQALEICNQVSERVRQRFVDV